MKFFASFILIAILSSMISESIAQQKLNDSIRNKFIESYSDDITLRFFLNTKRLDFNINVPNQNNQRILYTPNVATTWGFGFSFKKIGFGIGFKFGQSDSLLSQRGSSKYLDLRLVSFSKRIGYDINYQDYKGFYISNPDAVYQNWIESYYPQRSDLRILNISANVHYLFNVNHFSYRAVFALDERQLKSAGSFFLSGTLGYLQLRADSSLIPAQTKLAFENGSNFNKGNFYNIALAPGYAYNLVLFRSLVLSLGLSGTLGLQVQEYGLDGFDRQSVNLLLKFVGRAALAYNGKRIVAGFNFVFDTMNMPLDKIRIGSNINDITIYLGYRIKTKLFENKKDILDIVGLRKRK